jgi:hypothetical protein
MGFGIGVMRQFLMAATLAWFSLTPAVNAQRASHFDLTGAWTADDGGVYYVRQIGSVIWWAGFSQDNGRSFTNVFRGVWQEPGGVADEIDTIVGQWADLPRGSGTWQAGKLILTVNFESPGTVSELRAVRGTTGGFGGRVWKRTDSPPPISGKGGLGTFPPEPDLTGTWTATDHGTYYVREIGDTVWWLGVSAGDGAEFSNVFVGKVRQNHLQGEWADVPRGKSLNNGAVGLSVADDSTMRSTSSGVFENYVWQKRR